jgi:hypothetical protein
MSCGTQANAYHTLLSLVAVLPSGTVVDTAADDADAALRRREPALHEGLLRLRDRVRADSGSVRRIEAQFAMKNTMDRRTGDQRPPAEDPRPGHPVGGHAHQPAAADERPPLGPLRRHPVPAPRAAHDVGSGRTATSARLSGQPETMKSYKAKPITSHMAAVPTMVNSNVPRDGCEACASGRMSDVARYSRKPAKKPK